MSNGSSTGTGLRPIPAKICEVTAFSCTSAGVERGSTAGSRRWPENVKADATAGCVFGSELIENGAPFDADGRDRRCSEFVCWKDSRAGKEQGKRCQQMRAEPDSLRTQCVAPGANACPLA